MKLPRTGAKRHGASAQASLTQATPRRRYASLYFLACVDEDDNELIVLETIHHFVEVRASLHTHSSRRSRTVDACLAPFA